MFASRSPAASRGLAAEEREPARSGIDEPVVRLGPAAAGGGLGLSDGTGFAAERYDLVRSAPTTAVPSYTPTASLPREHTGTLANRFAVHSGGPVDMQVKACVLSCW